MAAAISSGAANAGSEASSANGTWSLSNGGFIELEVPKGRARAVIVELSEVADRNGTLANFRVEVHRANRLIASRRVLLQEPGGTFAHEFNRPFDRIRVYDDEGTLEARVTKVTFCPVRLAREELCSTEIDPEWRAVEGAPDRQDSEIDDGREKPVLVADGGTAKKGDAAWPIKIDPVIPVRVDRPQTGTGSGSGNGNGGSGGGGTGGNGGNGGNAGGGGSGGQTDGSSGGDTGGSPGAGGNEGSGGDTGAADDFPFFGERTPITRMTGVTVQAGSKFYAPDTETNPWADQSKLTGLPGVYDGFTLAMPRRSILLNALGMPIFESAWAGKTVRMGWVWGMTNQDFGSEDVAGTWLLSYGPDMEVELSSSMNMISEEPGRKVYRCIRGRSCTSDIVIKRAPDNAKPPVLCQLTDGDGRKVSDCDDLNDGLITRERWRRAMYGYGEFRPMTMSSTTDRSSSMIRYDSFARVEDASWNTQNPSVDTYGVEGLKDLNSDRGIMRQWVPTEARLRAAWEMGAIYHHNFPHLAFEHRGDVDPKVVGPWAEELWADQSIPLQNKLALFNDTELQHVDEFGADVMANRQYVVKNQVKVEMSNETWNFANPYFIQHHYYLARAEKLAKDMGRPVPDTGHPVAIQTGYDLTKAIARLRKQYPAIEWRGVMAIQTAYVMQDKTNHPWHATSDKWINYKLKSQLEGYELFWRDYEANRETWSKLYASKPELPGHWFEVHGTTYFSLSARRDDMKTHMAGLPPAELKEYLADRSKWPALRAEILDWFVNGPADPGQPTDERGSRVASGSAAQLDHWFRVLANHAALSGMQVGSYEGGNHADYGTHYYGRTDEFPGLKAFWRDFHDSTEFGLIQAAVHDRAVDAGWKTLADFDMFERRAESTIFGTRRTFADVNPIWCEFARWMPRNPPKPKGLEDAVDLKSPHQKCGAMIDYLNQARNNGYYVGQRIKSPEELIP
jgi:hypothetical protein